MNPAITAALLAAHEQSAAPSPVARLTKAKADSAEKAIRLEAATAAEQKLIDDAIASGLIHRRADGRMFVNRRAVDERNARIGMQLLVAGLAILSILASAAALILFLR